MELWEARKFVWSFTCCCVGSREVPEDIAALQRWIGHCLGLLRGVVCTGDATGSDEWFTYGYRVGIKDMDNTVPPQIYYTRLKNKRELKHSPTKGYHELEKYPDSQVIAQDMAYEARGSFNGLFPSGIALHTRNAFQVLSETLNAPRKFTVIYSKPVGNKGKVSGGTNTANMISRKYGVPVINLWVNEERDKFITWLIRQLTAQNIKIPFLGVFNEPQ